MEERIDIAKEIPIEVKLHYLVDSLMNLYETNIYDREKVTYEVIHYIHTIDIPTATIADTFMYMQNYFKNIDFQSENE